MNKTLRMLTFFMGLLLLTSTAAKLNVVADDVDLHRSPQITQKNRDESAYTRIVDALRHLDDGTRQHDVNLNDVANGISPERLNEVREVFDELDRLAILQADPTRVREAVQRLNNGTSTTDGQVIAEMYVLQSFLDDIDNSRDFCRAFDGVALLKRLFHKYQSTQVRTQIIRTIGIASQNNDFAINAMLDGNVVEELILNDLRKMMTVSLSSPERSHYVVKLIHTLSALTRQNARGLQKLKDLGASVVLRGLVENCVESRDCPNVIEKVMDFVSDVTTLNGKEGLIFTDPLWCAVMAHGLDSRSYSVREASLRYFEHVLRHSRTCVRLYPLLRERIKMFMGDFESMKSRMDADELEFEEDHLNREVMLLGKLQ